MVFPAPDVISSVAWAGRCSLIDAVANMHPSQRTDSSVLDVPSTLTEVSYAYHLFLDAEGD